MPFKRLFLSFAFFLFVSALCAQVSINQHDQSGKKTGLWETYHDNGKIKSRGTFLDGHPVGELLKYYPGGILQASMIFNETGSTSYVKMYYETGNLAAEGKYINQKKDSVWNYYSTYDKRKAMSETFMMGKKHGPSYKYYQGEKPSEFHEWQNDQKNGKWEQYFENGMVRLTGNYLADTLNGSFVSYNPDGSISISGSYTGGTMDGKWTYFTEEGEIEMVVEYKEGIMQPNPEMDKRIEEFSKKVKDAIGNLDETELPDV